MRRIFISQALPGMTLAKDIIKADGRVLLNKGITLTNLYIDKLAYLGISFIYISNPLINLKIPEAILEETRQTTIFYIHELFSSVNLNTEIPIDKLLRQVKSIISEILEKKDILVHLVDIRAYDDYVYCHSVNVATLAIITGVQLNLTHQELVELGLGALLHDIGKTQIDEKILNKPALLTPDEYEIVKNHSQYGCDILQRIQGLPSSVSLVAFQHHEWYNGNGYPHGIKDNNIHLYARIVSAIDVYDALTTNRVYRKAYQPYLAIEHIRDKSFFQFDPLITKKFLENIALYPIGSTVKLSNGFSGIVVNVRKDILTRPNILIKWDNEHNPLEHPYEMDLSNEPSIQIIEVI